ncbi:MAG: hypothetical protein ACFB10_14445 [Salibacteraceae bacterium]
MIRGAILRIGIALLALALLQTGCRKGEDDPFLSLRSRKARLVADWNLDSWSESYPVMYSGVVYPHEIQLNSNELSEQYPFRFATNPDSVVTFNYTGVLNDTKFEIKEDGRFQFQVVYVQSGSTPDGSSFTRTRNFSVSGTWSFLDGVGEFRNKERVQFQIENSVRSIEGPFPYFLAESGIGRDQPLVLTLKELRATKVVAEGETLLSWLGLDAETNPLGTIQLELSR